MIWDIRSKEELARLPVVAPVLDIEPISDQGEFLVAGKELQVWNFLTEEQAQALENPNMAGQKASTAFAGVGTNGVSASYLGRIPLTEQQQRRVLG